MNSELTITEMAVLGLIAESPRHGYQVEQLIAERGMREWTEIGFSSIYYLLNKMEAAGLLESDRIEGSERPARKVYRATQYGLTLLAEAVRSRLRAPRLRSGDFDLALANLWILPPEDVLAALETYAVDLKTRYASVFDKQERDGGGTLPYHVRALFDHSLELIRREQEWVEKWITQLTVEMNR